MKPQIQKIDNQSFSNVQHISYDADDKTIYSTTREGVLEIFNLEKSKGQKYQILSNSQQQVIQPINNANPTINKTSMRFSRKLSSPKAQISPSGLVVTGSSNTTEDVAISNYGLSKGVHYFEFFCPLRCQNIQMGIVSGIQENDQKQVKNELFVFKTSTPRLVGILLDLQKNVIQCWLNGNLQQNKNKKISSGTWHICVKIKDQGNIVVFNPFVVDPYRHVSLYHVPVSLPKEKKILYIKEQEQIIGELLKNVLEQLNQPQVESQPQIIQEQTNLQSHVLQNQNLLIINNEKIKLLRKNQQGQYPINSKLFQNKPYAKTDEITLQVTRQSLLNLFVNLDWNQLSSLYVNYEHLRAFLQNCYNSLIKFNKENYLELTTTFEIAHQAIQGISNLLLFTIENLRKQLSIDRPDTDQQQNQKQIVKQHSTEKKASNFQVIFETNMPFGEANYDEKQELENEQQDLLEIQPIISPLASIQSAQEQEKHDVYSHTNLQPKITNIDNLYDMLQTTLELEEQIYAMTLYEGVSSEVQDLFENRFSRLYTAFGRLSSFLGYTNSKYGLIEMCEVGLFSKCEMMTNVRHFEAPNVQLEKIENIRNDLPLSSNLYFQLRNHSRMLSGNTSGNINLDISINNIPYSNHSSNPNTQVKLFKNNSNYIILLSQDGIATLWNTEICLVRGIQANFRQLFQEPTEEELIGNQDKNKKIGETQQNTEPYLYKLIEGALSERTRNLRQPVPVEDVTMQADQNIVEQLYNMGFPLDICKKAAIKVHNESVSKALDIIFDLQEKEKSTEQPKIGINQIKAEWTCQACTFQNYAPSEQCEVCLTAAPISAYFTEKEINKLQEQEQQRKMAIQQLKQEQERQELEQKKKLEEERLKNQQLEHQRRLKTTKDFLNNSDIKDGVFIDLQKSKVAPFLFGAFFNKKDSYSTMLRIRRFGFKASYLQNFYKIINNGFICSLNNEWVSEMTVNSLERCLFMDNNNRLVVESLEPIFVGNSRCQNQKEYQYELFNSQWMELEEIDIVTEEDRVLTLDFNSVDCGKKYQEDFELFLLTVNQNNQHSINVYNIEVKSEDPYNGQRNLSANFSRKVNIADLKLLNPTIYVSKDGNDAIIVDLNQLIGLSNLKTEQAFVLWQNDFSQKINSVQKINDDIILVLDDSATVSLIDLKKKQEVPRIYEEAIAGQQIPIDSSLMNQNEINSLSYLLQTKYLGCIPQQDVFLSSNFDQVNKLYSKHLFKSNSEKLEVSFVQPTSLLSIELDLVFDNQSQVQHEKLSLEDQLIIFDQQDLKKFFSSDQTGQQKKSQVVQFLSQLQQDNEQKTHIPLEIVSYKGAQYNQGHNVSQMLVPNNTIFVSMYASTCYICQNLHEKQMIINQVIVKSAVSSKQAGYPIGSGLIFTAPCLSYLDQIQSFQSMSLKEYNQWKNGKTYFEYFEPVGAFEFDSQESLTVDLDFIRPCKYMMLKPTNFRSKPNDYQRHFKLQPIEICYIGCSGEILEEPVQQSIYRNPNPQQILGIGQQFLQNVTFEINQGTNSQPNWVPLKEITSNTLVDEQILSHFFQNSLKKYTSEEKIKYIESLLQKNISLSADVNMRYTSSFIKENKISGLRLIWNKDLKFKEWQLSKIGIQPFVAVESENHKQIQNRGLLRSYLLDIENYEKFNKGLVKQLINGEISLEQRKCIMKILVKLVNKDQRLAALIYKDLDLNEFIRLNVLREINNSFTETFSFLKLFNSEEFPSRILRAILDLMPKIANRAEITQLGLNGFFQLLNWSHQADSSLAYGEILTELYRISKLIKATRNQHYYALKHTYNIYSPVLESELFTDDVKEDYQPELEQAIKSRFVFQKHQMSRKYIVDLVDLYNIKEIFLVFGKNITSVIQFRVHIWSVSKCKKNGYKKKLIQHNYYEQQVFVQLANLSHDNPDMLSIFNAKQKITSLGYSHFDLNTRYLIIQISWTLQPYTGCPEEIKNIPQVEIIPEVYGDKISKGSLIDDLQRYFEEYAPNQVKYLKEVKVLNSNTYDKFEVVDTKNLGTNVVTLYDSIGLYRLPTDGTIIVPRANEIEFYQNEKSNHQVSFQGQIQSLQESLKSSQQELINKIQNKATKEEVEKNCKNIQVLQGQLYKIRGNSFLSDPQSLDFLYTLVTKYSKFLRKNLVKNIGLESKQSCQIGIELFETFIIFDEGPINSQIMSLLCEVIIENLVEQDWQIFVFRIVKNYLCKDLSSSDRLFSHTKIIKALDTISIPLGELLSYLALRLNIDVDSIIKSNSFSSNSPFKSRKQSIEEGKIQIPQQLTTIACILVLLKSGFKNIPFEVIDPRKVVHKGSYCFSCLSNKSISGTRYKCANCPNIDCCSKIECRQKHLLSHENHVFLLIEQILPLAPSKGNPKPQSLIPQCFQFQLPYTQDHQQKCDTCGNNIFGVKYMCSNCEEYNSCQNCYEAQEHSKEYSQNKYHVFLRFDKALLKKEQKGSSKILVPFLDPLLYPLKTRTQSAEQQNALQKKWSKGQSREIQKIQVQQGIEEEEEQQNKQENNDKLQLPGIKRSTSHPGKVSNQSQITSDKKESTILQIIEEEDGIETFRLDYEDSLRVSFQILVWISEAGYSEGQKVDLLILTIDLILEIMKLSNMNGLKGMLRNNDQNLFKLLFNVLKIQNQKLIAKFQLLIDNLIHPKNEPPTIDEAQFKELKPLEKQKINNEKLALEETKLTLVYYLQTVLQWVLDFSLNPNSINLYQQILKENIDQKTWLYHVEFILSFLLQTTESMPKQQKEPLKKKHQPSKRNNQAPQEVKQELQEDEIELQTYQLPGMTRAFSVNTNNENLVGRMQAQNVNDFLEKSQGDKQTTLSVSTAISLINLFLPGEGTRRKSFNFANSTKLWSLVMKSILKVKANIFLDSNIFDNLVTAYLKAGEDIQYTMLQELLQFTSNMLFNYNLNQFEVCNQILKVIFQLLDEVQVKNNFFAKSVHLNLVKGWFDILLTKTSPKPDDFYSQPHQRSYCKLSQNNLILLFQRVSDFMLRFANIGGRTGSELACEPTVEKLDIANDLLLLLITMQGHSNQKAISEIFQNSTTSQSLIKPLHNIIQWYILNRTMEKTTNSPSHGYMKSMTVNTLKLFSLVGENDQITKICLQELITILKQIDISLLQYYNEGKLQYFTTLSFSIKSCKALQELFDLWVTNDVLAQHVAFNVHGFQYLLERMRINKMFQDEEEGVKELDDNKEQNIVEDFSDVFQHLKEQLGTERKKNDNQIKQTKVFSLQLTSLDEIVEEELASKIQVVNSPGQLGMGIVQDWAASKKGIKNKAIFTASMTGQSYNEYVMTIQLENESEIRQIIIGFNSYLSDSTDKLLGTPSSIMIEGGTDLNNLAPLGCLQYLNDEGYSNSSQKVFVKNFQTIGDNCSDLDSSIQSLTNKRIKFIKFRIRRPVVTYMEGLSLLSEQMNKNISISLSFLSIQGFLVSNLPVNRNQKIVQIQQSSALQVIGKLCNQTFSNTLRQVANDKIIVDKIKNSFDTLSDLLITHEQWLSPVILAIAANNVEMGDWIINNFLQLQKTSQHSRMITEIITASTENALARIQKLHQFILNQLKLMNTMNKKDDVQYFASIVPFIDSLTSSLRISASDCYDKDNSKIIGLIDTTQADIDILLNIYEKYSNSVLYKIIIKLIITIVYVPFPYSIKDTELLKFTLDKIWTKVNQKPIFYELAAALIIGSKEGIDWILNNNGEKLDKFVGNFLNKIDKNQEKEAIRLQLFTLTTLSKNHRIQQQITYKQWHLKIYNFMKVTNQESQQILKDIDASTLKLIVEFLVNVILGNEANEKNFANILKSDISMVSQKRDLQFVQNLLVPLLNAEKFLPVCMHPYDNINKRWMIDGKKIVLYTKQDQQQKIETIQTNSQEQIKNNLINISNAGIGNVPTTLFNQKQQQDFANMIQQQTKGKYSKAAWNLVLTQNSDGQSIMDTVIKQVLKKPPFLIIMQGTNSGKNCICGVFGNQPLNETILDNNHFPESYSIQRSDECFIFYYEDNFTMHFNIPQGSNEYMGYLQFLEEGGGALSIMHGVSERIFLSFQVGSPTYVDINLADMKPIDTNKTNHPLDIPTDFVLQKVEYYTWQGQEFIQQDKQQINNSVLQGIQSNSIFMPQYMDTTSSLTYYRPLPIYNFPQSLMCKQIKEFITVGGLKLTEEAQTNLQFTVRSKKQQCKSNITLSEMYKDVMEQQDSNQILDLEFDALTLYEGAKIINKPINSQVNYIPQMKIFEAFEQCGGVLSIIDSVLQSMNKWKNQDRAERWKIYLSELLSFSQLPQFFNLFMKNRDCIELLFKLMAGLPDQDELTNQGGGESDKNKVTSKTENQNFWEEEGQKAVKFSYQILSDVFRIDSDSKIRIFALENQFIDRILDKIALITKEIKRKYVKDVNIVEDDLPATTLVKNTSIEEDGQKKIVKKKGVGYGNDSATSGMNKQWDVAKYVDTKKQKSEQVQGLIKILENILDFQNWKPPQKLLETIYESALLTLLESAFRGGGLLEMSKDSSLILCFLSITRVIAKNKYLTPLLLDIDPHYVPKQVDSIYSLLRNLHKTANIFIQVGKSTIKQELTQEISEQNQSATQLADDIIKTFEMVEKSCQQFQQEEEDPQAEEEEMKNILNLSLSEKYKILLSDLRFDYVSMKDQTQKYKHHYVSQITNSSPSQTKLVRLAQELADISTALPIEHTNAIFARCDTERVDVMKCCIMGAKGTPYAHGAFIYDIYFDDNYPNGPPKMNLSTTGNGKVRFNPNLYSCGKVCLSLLGTWRGNASENWDPKLSTLLQLLVSCQAIIMSDDVYFNEPGFEGEAGTVEGEKKNEAYSNIVRYCNIKFAMIEAIKNPTKGFETIIRRHFYLKKDEILEECNKWLKYASVREASYTGLINDHNNSWCAEFKKDKKKYHEMLGQAIKELEEAINEIPPPSFKELKILKTTKKKKVINKEKDNQKQQNQVQNIEEIDTGYEEKKTDEVQVNDARLEDQWSRYIATMGKDAVKKQLESSVFLSGLGPVGVEISKNIVLAGVKRFTIHDEKKVQYKDLSGQFFVSEEDLGKNRAQQSLIKIQDLNKYFVKVDTVNLDQPIPLSESELEEKWHLQDYSLVVLTEQSYECQVAVDLFCRKRNIKFMAVDTYGPFARLFNDFGDNHEVIDKNGEEPVELMLSSISNEKKGVVTLLAGTKHPYEDGDYILITEVQGMDSNKDFILTQSEEEQQENQALQKELEIVRKIYAQKEQASINGTIHKITTINSKSFYIGDTRSFTPYIRNGRVKNLKIPLLEKYLPLSKCLNTNEVPFDPNMMIHDFEKLNHTQILHVCFNSLDKFMKQFNRLPNPWSLEDMDEFIKLSINDQKIMFEKPEDEPKLGVILKRFSLTCSGSFPPLSAFLGGYASQEIVKALTNKYRPTKQFFYTDVLEVLPNLPEDQSSWGSFITQLDVKPRNHRTDGLRSVIGNDLLDRIQYTKLFMVGCGAIGCELLKNFSMLCLGTGEAVTKNGITLNPGLITITDPDHIETSNLNRQFLFRDKHLRKPKSQTAAAVIMAMNKLMKDHIFYRLDKVHEGTSHIFSDKFFENLTMVTNALDSIPARRYVDQRCVNSKIPLLESGTLGPKGHVQVIIPYLTESYGSSNDPVEEGEIPHCTLKMFPEETLHCVEWARDKFGKIFSMRPKGLLKILTDSNYQPMGSSDIVQLREAVKLLKNRPKNFDDCILYATLKFYKYFRNDIRQLIYTYPLDSKTKDGEPFWKQPKRPPIEISQIDPNDLLHATFITAFSVLRAKLFNIEYPKNFRNDQQRKEIVEIASKIKVPDFIPSDEKAKSIASQLDKQKEEEEKKEEIKEETQENNIIENEGEELMKQLNTFKEQLPKEFLNAKSEKQIVVAEEFEKDEDGNGHIDLIYSLANCRSQNYKLLHMDWLQVKIKAGRIVPALATTTASISGLQTIELVKILKGEKLQNMKNAFLNLAVPILQLTEPGTVPKIKLTEGLTVTLWDRWEVKLGASASLKDVFEYLEKTYKLKPKDVFHGQKLAYSSIMMDKKEKEKEIVQNKQFAELIDLDGDEDYVDITVTFTLLEGGEILKGVPTIRVYLK